MLSLSILTLFLLTAAHGTAAELLERTVTSNDCVAGQYFDSTSQGCKFCPAGSYTKEARQTTCIPARAGYYIPTSGQQQDFPCPQGQYTKNTGSTSCLPCPPGYQCISQNTANPQGCSPGTYATGGNIECAACPAGTFNNIYYATGCCECSAGWFNSQTHQTHCQECTPQQPYSPPGATSCSATYGGWGHSPSCEQDTSNGKCPSGAWTTGMMKRAQIPKPLCSSYGAKRCPVYSTTPRGVLKHTGYECVDVMNDLESCGGCPEYSLTPSSKYNDSGRDCSSIPNVDAVMCSRGSCVIQSCRKGYQISADGRHCNRTQPEPAMQYEEFSPNQDMFDFVKMSASEM